MFCEIHSPDINVFEKLRDLTACIVVATCQSSKETNSFLFRVLKVKVKQYHYRPGQALSVPGGWSSQISRQSAREGGKVVISKRRPPLTPRKYSWYSFLLEAVNPRAIVRPEGLCQWKIPMRPSGIQPATYRLVAQCRNRLRYRVPPPPL